MRYYKNKDDTTLDLNGEVAGVTTLTLCMLCKLSWILPSAELYFKIYNFKR